MRNIEQELAAMRRLTVHELRARYVELFGEPPRSKHKDHLVRRIAWRIQALKEGDLPEKARRRAAQLARDADLRLSVPRKARNGTPTVIRRDSRDQRLPMPGAVLVRQYHGEVLEVKVLPKGFEYDGQIFGSLTAVTKQITGKHWNGFHFFGLCKRGTR